MNRIVNPIIERCTGCRVCELACSEYHNNKYNLKDSRIRVVDKKMGKRVIVTCRQCVVPMCVKSCKFEALEKTGDGHIRVFEENCVGCLACVEACPFGAIWINSEGIAVVCDTCDGNPRCVEKCPFNALEFVTRNTIAQRRVR